MLEGGQLWYYPDMYLHELKEWPEFRWDSKGIDSLLIRIRHQQGRLIGGMGSIGFSLREEVIVQTLTQDVIKSSEIEGEALDRAQVRSSVARRLGIKDAAIDQIDRSVEGIVEMMLDATQKFDHSLTEERLFAWHAALFPNGRSGMKKIKVGMWRTHSVEVVSGPLGKEVIHFEGPPAHRVELEMGRFLNWLNQTNQIDLVLKAAIAHLWFITIHPFDDGNGRIGRAIADMLLARSENSSRRFYSLSAQIQAERKSYYKVLEQTQKSGLDITCWLEWFLGCLEKAVNRSLLSLEVILHKTRVWESLSKMPLNERQKKLLNCLLDGFKGPLTSSKWAKIGKCSQDTAYRDILDLVEQGVLVKNKGGGRNTSYSLAERFSFICDQK